MKKLILFVSLGFVFVIFLNIDTFKGMVTTALSLFLAQVPHSVWFWIALSVTAVFIIWIVRWGAHDARTKP